MELVKIQTSKLKDCFDVYEYYFRYNDIIFMNYYYETKNNFEFYPIHYGRINNITVFDNFLIINESILIDESVVKLSDVDLIKKDLAYSLSENYSLYENFTFQFDTEEEALYFKMKYDM